MIKVDVQVLGSFPKDVEKKLAKIKSVPEPAFARYVPNFQNIFSCAAKYSAVENFVIVAQGGAVSAFYAFFQALGFFKTTKKVFFVATTDPDYLAFVMRQCPVDKTLVVAISSSGMNVNQVEAFFAFQKYKRFVLARRLPSALVEIATRERLDFFETPDLSDRFAGQSELGLVPCALLYMPSDKIFAGAQRMYQKCRPSVAFEENPALKIATVLYLLEREQYHEVLVPIYSTQMFAFAEFITQIMHETVCKDGKGQTFLVMPAPEMQHHSSQRFFGGRKDIAGVFVRVGAFEQQDVVHVPAGLQDVFMREGYLRSLDRLPLAKSMEYEYQGTKEAADALQIPNITLTVERVTPESIGAFLALWEYIAFYAALLRDVDPFTQPAVEASKERSFALRKSFKA